MFAIKSFRILFIRINIFVTDVCILSVFDGFLCFFDISIPQRKISLEKSPSLYYNIILRD